MKLFNCVNRVVSITLSSVIVFVPVRAKAENFLPLTNEQLKANPHLCVPIVGQTQNNGIVVNQVIGNNCQSYLNGAFNLEAVREQEKTKRDGFETNAKIGLFQMFMSMPRK
mgnify:CR=1 FL=1